MRKVVSRLTVIVAAVLIPAAAYAQSTIVGVVKDTSGAVLPGVTVEAASPALIEKTRTVVTDGAGQYEITPLASGTYTVTFSLAGFNTVKREGIALAGSFTAKIDAEMRVGALAETITVTGETPIVDVQSATRETVLDRTILNDIPAGKDPKNVGVLIPGIQLSGVIQDVGGTGGVSVSGQPGVSQLLIHGSGASDSLYMLNGISAGDFANGYNNPLGTNPSATREMLIETAAAPPEFFAGGVRVNIIPRDGGNAYNGTFFGSFANSSMQASNLNQHLTDLGITALDHVKTNWDLNPGFGGPIKKDRLWFYFGIRRQEVDNYSANSYVNLNANNPNVWTYAADKSQQTSNDARIYDEQLRLTVQLSPRNKVGGVWHEEYACYCQGLVSSITSYEASLHKDNSISRSVSIDWTSPITNRLLFEGGALYFMGTTNWDPWPGLAKGMVAVVEQSNNLLYRSGDGMRSQQYSHRPDFGVHSHVAMSYITGTHAVKVGYQNDAGWGDQFRTSLIPYTYRFNNGVPNQITEFAYGGGSEPLSTITMSNENAVFAQDKWTFGRWTANYGLRFNIFWSHYPNLPVFPAYFAPTRNITFPGQDILAWKDWAPRLSIVRDVFGDGKTAFSVSLNKYLEGLSAQTAPMTAAVPTVNVVNSVTRSWTDRNGNFVPDCNLLSPAAQTVTGGDICGAISNANFGGVQQGTTYDPTAMFGWNKRLYNWEFAAGLQQQLGPRASLDVAYFRRLYGNFKVTDNQTVSASDYTTYSITAPTNPGLPAGGGNVIPGYFDLNPSKFGVPARNLYTLSSNFGSQQQHWTGFDMTINLRAVKGVLLRGGTSTGRQETDNCELLASLGPQVLAAGSSSSTCHTVQNWLTQVKILGSYTIPRVDVLFSATFQSIPGPDLQASYTVANAVIQPSLGRPLSGGAANATVLLLQPGTLQGDRLNQTDLRFGKRLIYGRARATLNFDLYNAFNGAAAILENSSYAVWRQPTNVLQGRFFKLALQFDY